MLRTNAGPKVLSIRRISRLLRVAQPSPAVVPFGMDYFLVYETKIRPKSQNLRPQSPERLYDVRLWGSMQPVHLLLDTAGGASHDRLATTDLPEELCIK